MAPLYLFVWSQAGSVLIGQGDTISDAEYVDSVFIKREKIPELNVRIAVQLTKKVERI